MRKMPDHALRHSLEDPENLRAFLHRAVPQLAANFVCEQATLVNREFPLDDWRLRECDLLFEIPYRVGVGQVQTVLVCVLIEHQSAPDARMPLRMLVYAVLYWERQWKAWEDAKPPRGSLKLRPVVPVVFHSSSEPWNSNRSLAQMMGPPEALHAFAPKWEPLFWDLAEQSVESLLGSAETWLQSLAVVRVEREDTETFRAVFTQVCEK